MTLQVVRGISTAEEADDLLSWLGRLPDAPAVHRTVLLACDRHGEDQPAWAYVEADPRAGVARRRCLACAATTSLLNSAERWTYPPMWSCGSCSQTIGEVAVGLSLPDGEHVSWLVVAVRCVGCGRVDGLTDLVVPDLPVADVLARL